MSSHITINGRTYSSVEEMPPDVRRRYEAAMQLLPKNAGALADATGGDVKISNQGFRTVTKTTSGSILVNGKEYSRWEDLPPRFRAVCESAGVGPHKLLGADSSQTTHHYLIDSGSSSKITLSLSTLIFLLAIALVLGVCVGYKLLH